MTSSLEKLRVDVEHFLDVHAMKPSDFGRQALGDPNFVRNLRLGRDARLKTVDRVYAFMRDYRPPRSRTDDNEGGRRMAAA